MTKRVIAAAVLSSLFLGLTGASSRALALATEHFGHEPVPPGFVGVFDFRADALALANLKQRFYWYEVNGNPVFFYQGDAAALNEALRIFATLPQGEVVLLPGPGRGHSLDGKTAFNYDWWLNVPSGFHLEGQPTLTVYIQAAAPAMEPDARKVARWLADLDSEMFATRSKASEELEKLGHDAGPALRRALEANPSPEARRAIRQLLGQLKGLDVREVRIPKGVKVLEVKDLVARHRGRLRSGDGTARGYAASALGDLANYTDVVPDLIAVLKEDKHEYARRSAAGALSQLGKRAAMALPLLKAGLSDPDVNVRNAFVYAIKQIEDAKEVKRDEEQAARQKGLLEGISAYRRALPAGPGDERRERPQREGSRC